MLPEILLNLAEETGPKPSHVWVRRNH